MLGNLVFNILVLVYVEKNMFVSSLNLGFKNKVKILANICVSVIFVDDIQQ
jgi:hypothetical protein